MTKLTKAEKRLLAKLLAKSKDETKTEIPFKARITEAFEGYKNYLVSKKILSQREAQNLKFEKVNNEQKTWTNVVKVSLNGKQYPSENKLYRCPAYKKNGKGYFLKGFSI